MATVNTNIKINIVEPSSPTPVDPAPADPVDTTNTITYTTSSTDISVPGTGLFTHGIGGTEATIITISIVAILAVVVIVLHYKKKHNNKVAESSSKSKLTNIISTIKSKKKVSIPLAILALVVSLGTLATLLVNAGKGNTSAIDNTEENEESTSSLTLGVDSEELTIEVGDEPVFAVLPVELTIEEATQAGYTLTVYTDNTDLVSTTNPNNKIPMVTVEGDELTTLKDNTWGLALDNEPTAKDNKVYKALSTDQDNPTIIKTIDDYSETEANDTTTIYYGFYITPDIPYGTYTGGEVEYEAEENTATVVFDGNGLYFNGDPTRTTNVVRYEIVPTTVTEKYSHTSNIRDDGIVESSVPRENTNEVIVIPGATTLRINFTYGGGYIYNSYLVGFASFWQGSHANYTADANYAQGIQSCGDSQVADGRYYSNNGTKHTVECDILGNTVTFGYSTYGGPSNADYGYYAVITGYDASGNVIYLPENKIVSGDYSIPGSDSYYRFLGWSKEEVATTPTYVTEEDVEKKLDLTSGEITTLYAVWEPAVTITYRSNGADLTTNMDNVEQYTTNLESTSQVDLLASNFIRKGYGFVGWSTDNKAWEHLTDNNEENNPTIYGPNQTITVDPSVFTKLNLYAVWAPAETTAGGDLIGLQNWQGCNRLTAATYDEGTGALSVGRNTITALTDIRDGNTYTVARLADGDCWMTENLRLANKATISTANTNNPIVVDGNVSIMNNDGNTYNHLSPTSNSWCTNSDATCINQSNLNTDNITKIVTPLEFTQDFTNNPHKNLNSDVYSYGNYYNWYSATAGQGVSSVSYGNVIGDICPSGWHLPYGGNSTAIGGGNTKGGYYYLNQQMGKGITATDSNNWRSFPNNFVYSGYYHYHSSADERGRNGYYWSSSANSNSSNRAYELTLRTTELRPGDGDIYPNYVGHSVRCVTPVQ